MRTLKQFVNESLTEKQENIVRDFVVRQFEKLYTEDYWHFSTEYLYDHKAVYEIHSEMGSFRAEISINNKKPVKKSLSFRNIDS